MTIRIVTDSTCDLPDEIVSQLNITVVPLYINVGDKGYLDGVEISRREFYVNLPHYFSHPTTGTPGIDTFLKIYKKLSQEGASQIISVHISESLSATVDVALNAAQQFNDVPVTVLDSQQLSLGTGFQVEAAARLAKEGKGLTEILAALEDLASRTFVAAALDTLDYLRRSGRMSAIMASLGSLLQLKPILTMFKGEPGSERVRTTSKAFQRLAALLEERQPIERFALLHTNAPEAAENFRMRIAHFIPEGLTYSMDITPVIGAHIGPGAVGFSIISKK
ncbi:MAG: DegV family protein [Anaerolineales bacterium]|nr:DegV family protein [Anaerolineales bacterium]